MSKQSVVEQEQCRYKKNEWDTQLEEPFRIEEQFTSPKRSFDGITVSKYNIERIRE